MARNRSRGQRVGGPVCVRARLAAAGPACGRPGRCCLGRSQGLLCVNPSPITSHHVPRLRLARPSPCPPLQAAAAAPPAGITLRRGPLPGAQGPARRRRCAVRPASARRGAPAADARIARTCRPRARWGPARPGSWPGPARPGPARPGSRRSQGFWAWRRTRQPNLHEQRDGGTGLMPARLAHGGAGRLPWSTRALPVHAGLVVLAGRVLRCCRPGAALLPAGSAPSR